MNIFIYLEISVFLLVFQYNFEMHWKVSKGRKLKLQK